MYVIFVCGGLVLGLDTLLRLYYDDLFPSCGSFFHIWWHLTACCDFFPKYFCSSTIKL